MSSGCLLGAPKPRDAGMPQTDSSGTDVPKHGVKIKPKTCGQKESRPEHMLAEKHNIGHKELFWIKRVVAGMFGESDPAKICAMEGKQYICIGGTHPRKGKRYHIEITPGGIFNAWVPTRSCVKSCTRVPRSTYAVYNNTSKRFHYDSGPLKGKFAKGKLGQPCGLVTQYKQLTSWKDPTTGSPRNSPFSSRGKSSNKAKVVKNYRLKPPPSSKSRFSFGLSQVAKEPIRRSSNFFYEKNIHNLDAGMREVCDGGRSLLRNAVLAEFASAFEQGMSNRGYPARRIVSALNMLNIAQPL